MLFKMLKSIISGSAAVPLSKVGCIRLFNLSVQASTIAIETQKADTTVEAYTFILSW